VAGALNNRWRELSLQATLNDGCHRSEQTLSILPLQPSQYSFVHVGRSEWKYHFERSAHIHADQQLAAVQPQFYGGRDHDARTLDFRLIFGGKLRNPDDAHRRLARRRREKIYEAEPKQRLQVDAVRPGYSMRENTAPRGDAKLQAC